MYYLLYLCLLAHSGVQHILCCVFLLLFFILCTIYCQFLWIVYFWLPLQYSLTYHFHKKGCLSPLSLVLALHILLKCMYLGRKVSGHFCICFASFYDFDIWIWNCSHSVIFFSFYHQNELIFLEDLVNFLYLWKKHDTCVCYFQTIW